MFQTIKSYLNGGVLKSRKISRYNKDNIIRVTWQSWGNTMC